MNPWIQNVSLSDIRKGFHIDAGINSMLIQICDPPGDFPTPKHQFKEVHQFQFLDVEEKDEVLEEAIAGNIVCATATGMIQSRMIRSSGVA